MSQLAEAVMKRIGFVAAWYDLWIGMYWNAQKRRLYVLPVPCLGFYIDFGRGRQK